MVATEGRAFHNAKHAGLTFWAPVLNLLRDPRWGRGQESPGEDPILIAAYGEEYIKGMQQGEDPRYYKVSAAAKAVVAYSVEGKNGTAIWRMSFNAQVTAQDLHDSYLPGFAGALQPSRGNASGVMCAYTAVNGIPSCASRDLLQGELRRKMGFGGYVVTDCLAVEGIFRYHNYTSSPEAACAAALNAGVDIACGPYLVQHCGSALARNLIAESTVDEALQRQLATHFRLGLFDPQDDQPYAKIGVDAIDTVEHRALALDAARQALVLLKNNHRRSERGGGGGSGGAGSGGGGSVPSLPLSQASVSRVAVVGPLANATTELLGNYFGWPSHVESILDGVRAEIGAQGVSFAPGCDLLSPPGSAAIHGKIAAAVRAAAGVDAIVLVVGLNRTIENERHDRSSLLLPGAQHELLSALSAAAGQASIPLVVVVVAGGAIDLSMPRDDANVSAILLAGYGGQAAGTAVADALFGM